MDPASRPLTEEIDSGPSVIQRGEKQYRYRWIEGRIWKLFISQVNLLSVGKPSGSLVPHQCREVSASCANALLTLAKMACKYALEYVITFHAKMTALQTNYWIEVSVVPIVTPASMLQIIKEMLC